MKRNEAVLGRDHAVTLELVGSLGLNYKAAGRVAEALPLLAEGYRAAKKYPKLAVVGPTLLDCYVLTGKTGHVTSLANELVVEKRKALPNGGPQLADQLAPIGRSLLQAKAYADADPVLRECLAIREKTQPDAWTTFNNKSMVGAALLGQKKYAEAEPLLKEGYKGMKQREKTMPPAARPRLTEALERLVQLYDAQGNADEADRWRKELAAHNAAMKEKK